MEDAQAQRARLEFIGLPVSRQFSTEVRSLNLPPQDVVLDSLTVELTPDYDEDRWLSFTAALGPPSDGNQQPLAQTWSWSVRSTDSPLFRFVWEKLRIMTLCIKFQAPEDPRAFLPAFLILWAKVSDVVRLANQMAARQPISNLSVVFSGVDHRAENSLQPTSSFWLASVECSPGDPAGQPSHHDALIVPLAAIESPLNVKVMFEDQAPMHRTSIKPIDPTTGLPADPGLGHWASAVLRFYDEKRVVDLLFKVFDVPRVLVKYNLYKSAEIEFDGPLGLVTWMVWAKAESARLRAEQATITPELLAAWEADRVSELHEIKDADPDPEDWVYILVPARVEGAIWTVYNGPIASKFFRVRCLPQILAHMFTQAGTVLRGPEAKLVQELILDGSLQRKLLAMPGDASMRYWFNQLQLALVSWASAVTASD